MLDYTAIDFETANSYRGSPCAVGLVRVRNAVPVDARRWLMRPPELVDYFDPFNTWVHGITAEDVANEPRWNELLSAITEFFGADLVVAHNAGFDIGVMRYACAADNIEWPAMRFLCATRSGMSVLDVPNRKRRIALQTRGAVTHFISIT
jgi:DNA polymerase-3 subunit epsilon